MLDERARTVSRANLYRSLRSMGLTLEQVAARAGVAPTTVINTLKLHDQEETNELTERQLQLLSLSAEGLVHKEVADRMNMSQHTVKYHVQHIIRRLKVPNVTAAVAKAIRLGLI